MKIAVTFFIFFLAIAVTGNGQNRFVLEGTIGKYPVVFRIEKEYASYFYKNKHRDIDLNKITDSNGRMLLVWKTDDTQSGKEVIRETIDIHRSGTDLVNEWKGSWTDGKGKQLDVQLKKIDTTKYAFEAIPDLGFENDVERIYSKARLSAFSFVSDSVKRMGKYEIEMRHEPFTKAQSIRIKSGLPAVVLKKINTVLKEKEYTNLFRFFDCASMRGDDKEFEYDFWINDIFISDKYLSVNARLNTSCGGPHPNADDASFTFDTKTGKEITDLSELFLLDGETIVKILTKLHPAEMQKPASEDDCDYSEPRNWDYPEWRFTAKGLYIGTSFPHARNNCNGPEFSVIPYAILKRYEKKN